MCMYIMLCIYACMPHKQKTIQLRTLVDWQSCSGWCHCIPVAGLENVRAELDLLHLDAVASGGLGTKRAH